MPAGGRARAARRRLGNPFGSFRVDSSSFFFFVAVLEKEGGLSAAGRSRDFLLFFW